MDFLYLAAALALLLPWPGSTGLPEPLAWLAAPAAPAPAAPTGPGSPAGQDAPAAQGAIGAPAYNGCGDVFAPAVNAAYEQEVVALVNQERQQAGLPPLKRAPGLEEAARYHAADLAQDEYFEHDTYDRVGGVLQWTCSTWQRIASYYSGAHGENIAAGYTTPQAVMAGWMNSAGHRANILRTASWEIGVGYYSRGGAYSRYWVQDFGRQAGVYPLVIDREAASTRARLVSVYIYGDWQQMRLREDGGGWSAWTDFQNEFEWTLVGGAGERTLWAELRSLGSSAVTSDTITLDIPADAPALGDLPDQATFAFSIPDQSLHPASLTLTPRNVGNDDPLTWTLTATGDWYTIDRMQGSTPQSFTITPGLPDTQLPLTYTASITVTAVTPPGVGGSPQRLDLTLLAIDSPFENILLPLVVR